MVRQQAERKLRKLIKTGTTVFVVDCGEGYCTADITRCYVFWKFMIYSGGGNLVNLSEQVACITNAEYVSGAIIVDKEDKDQIYNIYQSFLLQMTIVINPAFVDEAQIKKHQGEKNE